jgi:hypothetical protein
MRKKRVRGIKKVEIGQDDKETSEESYRDYKTTTS